jgi:hypothetical protein
VAALVSTDKGGERPGFGRSEAQESLERMVSLARGPKGEQGATGEQGQTGRRGERGLSRVQGRAVVVLFLIAALSGVGNLFWTSHSVGASASAQQHLSAAEQAKWCNLIITLDTANATAPKRPSPGTFTAKFTSEIHVLRKSLGCGSAP